MPDCAARSLPARCVATLGISRPRRSPDNWNAPWTRCLGEKLLARSYHVLTPDVSRGDAIAQDALGMLHALRARGLSAYLYAQNFEPGFARVCRHVSHYLAGPQHRPDDVL